MLVKYKAILYGDKPIYYNFEGNKNSNSIYECEFIECEYCCELMKDAVENKEFIYFEGESEPIMCAYISYYEYGEHAGCKIYCCPFCGKPIKFKEIKRTKLKEVNKVINKVETDYIEEEIK